MCPIVNPANNYTGGYEYNRSKAVQEMWIC